jgi:hypothetical protein
VLESDEYETRVVLNFGDILVNSNVFALQWISIHNNMRISFEIYCEYTYIWSSKEFDKLLAVADLANRVDFLNDVSICIFEIQSKCNFFLVYNDGLVGLQLT